MTTEKRKFTSRVDASLLAELRQVAKQEGRPFREVLEDAKRLYLAHRVSPKVRAIVMEAFQASVARNRELGRRLAK